MKHGIRPTPDPDVNAVLHAFLADVRTILGADFVGLYLYGSLALGDFNPDRSSDIDFLVVTADEIPRATIAALAAMHERMAASESRWATELEGSYIPVNAVRRYDVRRNIRNTPAVVGQWAHDGWPPLHLAAYFGHRETAEALLDAGADVLAVSRNAEGNLAINAAAAGPRAAGRPDIVRLLIGRGSPVDGRGSPTGYTPLHEAASNGDVALVRLLLASGADRSRRTGDGQTALDIAGKHGRLEAARLLGG